MAKQVRGSMAQNLAAKFTHLSRAEKASKMGRG